ncbi:MAG: PorV/PorQ family protein [Elusimicrobia bacterium]|nr:PorV/PorQ family protein [Elusimicrobiota bacterium]
MKAKAKLIFLFLLPLYHITTLPRSCWAEAGRTAATFLSRPIGARASAMGQAFTAVEGGIDSLGYNPGALGALARPSLSSMYSTGLSDEGFSFLGYGHPTAWGTFSAGMIYFNGGSVELNLSSGLREYRKAEQDMVEMLSYSVQIFPGFFVGLTGKLMQFKLVEQFSAKSEAVDGGILWKTPWPNLSLGGALLNVGKEVKFEQEGDPLPKTWRVGATYSLALRTNRSEAAEWVATAEPSILKWVIALDEVQVLHQSAQTHLGMELRKIPLTSSEVLANLRFGYILNRDIDSLSLGIGFEWGQLVLDYGFGLVKDLNSTHRVSVGWRF